MRRFPRLNPFYLIIISLLSSYSFVSFISLHFLFVKSSSSQSRLVSSLSPPAAAPPGCVRAGEIVLPGAARMETGKGPGRIKCAVSCYFDPRVSLNEVSARSDRNTCYQIPSNLSVLILFQHLSLLS